MQQDIAGPASSNSDIATLQQLHGVLLRVFDIGVMLQGESGIGKSESALDLISRGHQLVADDVIEVFTHDGELHGRAPELTFELLEIRGLGIINVRGAFGSMSVRRSSKIDLCIQLQTNIEVERLGNVVLEKEIAGRNVQMFALPVTLGRNLATLIETAARIFINRDAGADAAERLIAKQRELLNSTKSA